jgi:hypothetical protein
MRITSAVPVFFLTLGLLVGLAAAAALMLGVDPTRFSPFLVKVALYKLTFIAAAGLLTAGALLGRHARRVNRRDPAPLPPHDEASRPTSAGASGGVRR